MVASGTKSRKTLIYRIYHCKYTNNKKTLIFGLLGSFGQKGLNMRKFIEIDLHHQQMSERQLVGRELIEQG